MSLKEAIAAVYPLLPDPARRVVANVRGFQLRRWRYGSDTETLVEQILEREQWSPAHWEAWTTERLQMVLERAATSVSYYRETWGRRQGDVRSLADWPVLEKHAVRMAADRFVADDQNRRAMFHEQTSGTTGTPLDLWWSAATVRTWYALFEARVRRWNGVSLRSRWANLGGQLVVPAARRRPPFWVWNRSLNQLYMSSYHLAPDLIPAYLDALRVHRIEYLFGYPSSLYALALGVLASGRRDWPMKVVITNAEPLFDYQRETIADAFGCPVRATYGMAEIVATATECEVGALHVWPEAGVIEVVAPDGCSTEPGEPGELIATGLVNIDMPLVRYRTGDRGALAPGRGSCACGRTLPVLQALEGRTDEMLFTRDGRRIGRLDPVFKADLPLHEAQIVQETLSRIRVRIVPAEGWARDSEGFLARRLRERLGDIEVTFETLSQIPRGANGKFRAVVCEIPSAEHPRTDGSRDA